MITWNFSRSFWQSCGAFLLSLLSLNVLPDTAQAQRLKPIDDPAFATNDKVVNIRPECPGLFIPRVFETRFQGMIPVYAINVTNKSNKRYTVNYDMVLTQRGDGVMLRGRRETITRTKEFAVRPNTVVEFLIAEKRTGSWTVESIDAIDVFKCEGI